MPPKIVRRNVRRRRRFRPRKQHFIERFSFSLITGNSQSLTIANSLSSLPPNRAFRVMRISVDCTTENVGSCALSVTISEATQILNTSTTRPIGSNGRRISVFTPRTSDYVFHSVTDTWQYGILEAICLHSGTTGSRISGIVSVLVYLQPEQLAPTCPSLDDSTSTPSEPRRIGYRRSSATSCLSDLAM